MTQNEKLFVRAFAFISSIIILIASIFYNGLNVFAYNVTANNSTYLMKDVCRINGNFYDKSDYDNILGYDTDLSSLYTSSLSQDFPFTFAPDNNGATYENYFSNGQHYVTYGTDLNLSSCALFLGDADSLILYTSSGDTYVLYSDISNIPSHPNYGVPSMLFMGWSSSNGSMSILTYISNYQNITLDGSNYLAIPITQYVIETDMDIKRIDDWNISANGSYTSSGSINNPNSGGSSETSANNLYLSNSDFTFSNSRFVAPYSSLINTGGIYPNGTISFSGLPNDYQRDHSNDFILTFGFQFRYNVTYKNQGTSAFGPFKVTSTILNSEKNYKTMLNYNNGGIEYIDVPLSTFISNGNSCSWTMENILSHMQGDFDYSTLLNQSKELTSVSYNAFDIVCNAYISSGSDSSGDYSEWYNPMSNKGYTTSENMKVNDNPYYGDADSQGDSDYYGELNAPGSAGNGSGGGSSSSISNSSTGEIVINNYNELNVGDTNANGGSGSGSGAPSSSEEAGLAFNFYNTFNPFSLIFNKMVGDHETIADDTLDTIGANSFISFLSSTFSFLPLTFWEKFTWYIGACLGILIVAVVLRVILDLL